MATKTVQLIVAKCEEEELDNIRTYLQNLDRTFIVPLNLDISLENYQDKDSDILQHPKWIKDMVSILEEIDKYLSKNPKNYVGSGSILHTKIKECLSDDNI